MCSADPVPDHGPERRSPVPEGERAMPWYWILIILSAIVGPFEAMHALNKARRNREQAEKRRAQGEAPDEDAVKQADREGNGHDHR